MHSFNDIPEALMTNLGQAVTVDVVRAGKPLQLTLVPMLASRFLTDEEHKKPPGALVPACMPLTPLRTSMRSLFSSAMAVSALMGSPSRR